MITLYDLGFSGTSDNIPEISNNPDFQIARIITEHKERYTAKTIQAEYEAEITGNLRFSAKSRTDFPVVGDWVVIQPFDTNKAIIHNILPRKNSFERQAVGKFAETQPIAANIDIAFIMQAADRDFNVNRLERYLTICNTSKISPIIIINKSDLLSSEQLSEIDSNLKSRINCIPVVFLSNTSKMGYSELSGYIQKNKTYCLLGSSGVGKSTLLNNLIGTAAMQTGDINTTIQRGKHVTSYRQLFLLPTGGLVIDNPGMREIGLTSDEAGVETTFDQIHQLAQQCKYSDCKHMNEAGCAIIEALQQGIIENKTYENYLKLRRETAYFEMNIIEKRKHEKQFGKIMKQYKKDLKKNNNDKFPY